MQKSISCLVIAFFFWSAQAAETGTIAEIYGYTYQEGKTLVDLNTAAAQWLKQFDQIDAGKTAADVAAAEKLIMGATKGMGFATYRPTPWLANPPFDNVFLSVSDDLGAFASNNSKYMTSSAGANADAAMFSSQSCESGLWLGHLIRRPAAPAQ